MADADDRGATDDGPAETAAGRPEGSTGRAAAPAAGGPGGEGDGGTGVGAAATDHPAGEPHLPARPPITDPAVRRRLEEVFGDLPRVTSDELDLDEPAARRASAADRELLANRPPHHDQR